CANRWKPPPSASRSTDPNSYTLFRLSPPDRAEDSSPMRLAGVALLVCAGLAPAANLADADKLLKQIKLVSKEGAGNQEAGAAWRELVSLGGEAILPTLAAM